MQRLGHYTLIREIGRGGMGVVHEAEDERLGRRVALKLLLSELAQDVQFRSRFVRESRAAAALDHPNILPVFDAGEIDGVLFIASRLVTGTDLRETITREGPLGTPRTLALVSQVASALDAAHARGIVHRDVKPANVLLVPADDPHGVDHAYLIDFGITTGGAQDLRLTQTGHFVGTPDYVAPEQINERPVDGRADQYALACVLHECVTGRPPFQAESAVGILHAHLHDPPPRLGTPTLDEALQGGLAKDPEHRYRSCRAFAAAARGPGQDTPTAPEPTVVADRPATPRRPRAAPNAPGDRAAPYGQPAAGGPAGGAAYGTPSDRIAPYGQPAAGGLAGGAAYGTPAAGVGWGETPTTAAPAGGGPRTPRPPRTAVATPRPGPAGLPPQQPERRSRLPAILGALLLVLLAGGGVAAVVLLRGGDDDKPKTTTRAQTNPPPTTTGTTTTPTTTESKPPPDDEPGGEPIAFDADGLALRRYDLKGYTVDLPDGWRVVRRDESQNPAVARLRTELVSPDEHQSILIDTLPGYPTSAEENRAFLDRTRAGKKPGYRRVGFDDFADGGRDFYGWTYRFDAKSGTEARRADVFLTDGGALFAVLASGYAPYDDLATLARRVATTIQPTATATGNGPPVDGTYGGRAQQSDPEDEYDMTMTFAGDSGTVDYPTLKCRGTLTRRGQDADGREVYAEQITSGTCDQGGSWTVTSNPPYAVSAAWKAPGHTYTVTAELTR